MVIVSFWFGLLIALVMFTVVMPVDECLVCVDWFAFVWCGLSVCCCMGCVFCELLGFGFRLRRVSGCLVNSVG